jgi:serine/threonine-protein kinase
VSPGDDSERFERIQELFHAAADLPEPERVRFLDRECDDPEIRSEVLALIKEDARGNSMLDGGLERAAQAALGGEEPASLPDQTFGPYRLLRLLGEGGMGVVYLGRRDDLDSVAAIKILRDAWLSPARHERFLREQRALAQLSHPFIAQIYDADALADGTPWFAMEYVEGQNLTAYCAQVKPGLEARLRLFRAICEAVHHAHLHAVIHRDLKPFNILVTADGTPKLLDFGIAKQMDETQGPADQTRTALRFLTPAYASPEQVRGERVGVFTDVYALGVILYELLAGQPPFPAAAHSPAEMERLVVERTPEKPSTASRMHSPVSAGPSSWADLDVLCLTAMHKDPARRYRSVEALIADVDRFLNGQPLAARPDTAAYRLGKFVRRNRLAVGAAALVAVTLIGLTGFYTAGLARARNEALAEAARTQRVMKFLVNLFEGGDSQAGPANDLRVVTLVGRGVEQARGFAQDPESQAELYRTLGDVQRKLGNLDKADELLRAALESRRARLGGQNALVAESMVDLALLRSEQARLDEAEKLARDALDMSRRVHPAGHPAVAKAMEALGAVQEDRGTYDDAIRTLEEAVRLRTLAGGAPADLAGALLQLANVHFYAGHYAEAEALNRRVLAMHREIYGPQHPLVAGDLANLGAIQQDTGHYEEAEKYHRQALEITEAFYGADHPKTASSLTLVGRALVFQKRLQEAEALLGRALSIRERVYGPDHPQVASSVNELGNIAIARGQYGQAEARFRRIVAIYRKAYSGKHYLIGIGLANLASVYMNRKDFARAEPLFREALAMYATTLPPGHINNGITQIKLGRTLLRQKKFTEAEQAARTGYDIVSRQASPAVTWLQSARQDLAEVYDALGQKEEAQRYRAEREAAASARK